MVVKTKARVSLDLVTAYAEDVVAGRVVAGPLVRLACARHIKDLTEGPKRGLRWDLDAANRAIEFFGFLRLAEGQWAGQPFQLLPWQMFIVGSLFGWKGPDGYRRFRLAYIEAGKGCGKTPLVAGIGLYGLVADAEAGAEIYTAGVTRDQANYLLNDAVKMVEASPGLRARIEVSAHNLAVLNTNSFMRPVSSEARSLDQKRVHMALIDEIHEHATSMVVDKMRAGTKGRRQALIFEITNSGYDRQSVCWQHHQYSARVLEGAVDNDAWFAYVCGLDEGDKWEDEACWPKANPSLDVIVTRKYLREQVEEALGMPAKQNIVKRLNFCIWTESSTRWLGQDVIDRAMAPLRDGLDGATCYAGLDLASTTDIAAFGLLFPDGEGGYDVMLRYWVPEEGMRERSRKDRVPYDVWVSQGWIKVTPGNVTDYDIIREDIKALSAIYQIRQIAYDPWNATQIATQLQGDGATMVPFRQGFASMAAPTKELQKLMLGGCVRFGADPVIKWMLGNLVVEIDAAANMKPSKEKSTEKIDGAVAVIDALGRAIVQGNHQSIYETRGLTVI